MPSNKPARRLLDIIENGEAIASYIAGLDETAFTLDRKTRDAVERCLQRITEAAIKLDEQAPALIPGYPWKKFRGLGNRLRHDYDTIEIPQIWRIASMQLPSLVEDCREALVKLKNKNNDPDGP